MRHISLLFVLLLATTSAFAAPANTTKIKSVYNSAYCTSGFKQLCNAPNLVKLTVTKKQRVSLVFTASELGCSSVRIRPSINGSKLSWSAFLGYSGSGTSLKSRTYSLGVLPAGTFLISTVAEGTSGGCNIGYLGSWGGTFTFTGEETTVAPTRKSTTIAHVPGIGKVKL